MIEFKNIYKIFGRYPQKGLKFIFKGGSKEDLLSKHGMTVGVHDISLKIKTGEFFVIMGLSGSGKSTLVRHLNRLMEPTSGSVWVEDQNIMEMNPKELLYFRRYKVSMVFQKFGLLPHKTVLQNVSFGLKLRGEKEQERVKKAFDAIEAVGLSGYEKMYPASLSGGMQQRVGIARALAVETPIMIMDEPFGALDPLIRAEMQNIVLDLKKKFKKTFVFVTHDLSEAVKLSDRLCILKDGKLIQLGTPRQIVESPATEYVKNFVQSAHLG